MQSRVSLAMVFVMIRHGYVNVLWEMLSSGD